MAASVSQPPLSDLVKSINDTAQTARNVLTAMLVVAVSLTATVIATTDLALLRDSADVLPSLGVRMPVTVMYALAPPVFVFLHVNALLQLHLLSGRLAAFEEEMKALPVEADRRRWRQLLHGFAFVQLLAGAESREVEGDATLPLRFVGRLGRGLLQFVVSVSLYGLPILLLLAAQISFMRYQSWIVTGVQIAVLVVDIVLILWLRFALRLRAGRPGRRRYFATVGDITVAFLVLMIGAQAVPPGPALDDSHVRWDPANRSGEQPRPIGAWDDIIRPILSYETNVFDRATCGLIGVACRYLRLVRRTLINEDAKPGLLGDLDLEGETLRKAKADIIRLSLRGRNLRFADFENSKLFAVDLTEAQLESANFKEADLQGATFADAVLRGANLEFARLQGASLFAAQLQGAYLRQAELQGADLRLARLEGANLYRARLHGAELNRASLHGASLFEAQLQGADITKAKLLGANLERAMFQGARLDMVELLGASGRKLECSLLLATNVSFGPWTSAAAKIAEIEKMLEPASTPEQVRWMVSRNLKMATTRPFAALTCADGSRLDSERKPPFDRRAQYLRSLACRDGHAAASMVSARVREVWRQTSANAYALADLSALSQAADADCPGLAKLPAALRKDMDELLMTLMSGTELLHYQGR